MSDNPEAYHLLHELWGWAHDQPGYTRENGGAIPPVSIKAKFTRLNELLFTPHESDRQAGGSREAQASSPNPSPSKEPMRPGDEPRRGAPHFDYARLEREMWERVEQATKDLCSIYDYDGPLRTRLIGAIRTWGFAYRLAKEAALERHVPADRPE